MHSTFCPLCHLLQISYLDQTLITILIRVVIINQFQTYLIWSKSMKVMLLISWGGKRRSIKTQFQGITMIKLVTGLLIQTNWVKIKLKVVIDVVIIIWIDMITRVNWMINLIILWIRLTRNIIVVDLTIKIIIKITI